LLIRRDQLTARDRYTVDLRCPHCGKTDEAQVSEDDGWAYQRDVAFAVDRLPEGFVVARRADSLAETEFRCSSCGKAALADVAV
jgi:predicted RNA-binding Zn-ribbon protein involved in translation (DUF1610 family)